MKRLIIRLCLVIFSLELLLFLLSWLIRVMVPQLEIKSLLTGEGIRWVFSHAESSLLSPVLVWLLFAAIAWGSVRGLKKGKPLATYLTILIAMIYIGVISLLVLTPQAPLLSVTGSLFPSAFSQSLAAILCVAVCLCSFVYGSVSGSYGEFSALFESIIKGIADFSPLILLYILATHLIAEIQYIL